MLISEDLDELTFELEADGVLVRKQLDRVVLTRGAWATVMFLYQDLDRATGAFRAPRAAIVRFQKWRGGYRKHASFNLSSAEQALELVDVLGRWAAKMGAQHEDGEDGGDGGDDDAPAERGAEA
jgi:hypothetical protein